MTLIRKYMSDKKEFTKGDLEFAFNCGRSNNHKFNDWFELNYLKNRFKNGDLVLKSKIIEISIIDEMLQDCYLYYAMDAPTKLKNFLLKTFSDKIDDLILSEAPNHVDKKSLSNKLNKIIIKTNGINSK